MGTRELLKKCCFILLAISPAVCILLLTKYLDPLVVIHLTDEDGIIENFSAGFYLVGFLFCFWRVIINKQKPKAALILWMVLCILFFGEETSWCQRFIGFDTPEIIERENTQEEFNLHNLEFLQVIATTETGYPILGTQNIFRAGFCFYFIALPIIGKFSKFKFIKYIHKYEMPSKEFSLSIFTIIIVTLIFSLSADTKLMKSAIGEIHEMFYAFIIMYYVMRYLRLPAPYLAFNAEMPSVKLDVDKTWIDRRIDQNQPLPQNLGVVNRENISSEVRIEDK